MEFMQTLGTVFKVKGHTQFTMNVMRRVGRVVIVKVIEDATKRVGWEVAVIQIVPANTLNGYDYPEREMYPSPSHWGIFGWTFLNTIGGLRSAIKRFRSACGDHNTRRRVRTKTRTRRRIR